MRALRSHAASPNFAEATAELSEWFWDGCLEECSEVVGEALQDSCLAQANFEALASMDSIGPEGCSAATEVLGKDILQPSDMQMLTEALRSRPRLFRVGPINRMGRRRLHEVQGGGRRSVDPHGWPIQLKGGDLVAGRLIGRGDDSQWVGPVYPFPSGTASEVIMDVRQGLRDLSIASTRDLAAHTERFLVDLHHQWFFHVFATRQQVAIAPDPPAAFTLLRGSVRPSG